MCKQIELTILTTSVIGASLSEPHTSESKGGFFIHITYESSRDSLIFQVEQLTKTMRSKFSASIYLCKY